MRESLLLIVLIAAFVLSAPPPAKAQQLGVVVKSATFDPAKQEITIRFYNSTKHDVTAFNYSVRVDYADGTSNLEDRGLDLAVNPDYRGFLLLAGTTREEKVEQSFPNKAVSRITAFTDMVVYDDASAEVLNESAFNRLIQRRKARVVATQKLTEILRQTLSADEPGKAALSELDRLKNTYKSGPTSDADSAGMVEQIQLAINDLNERFHGPLTTGRLQAYIKEHEDRVPVMKFHSELRRVGQ